MAKRATSYELSLPPRRSGTPAYQWLYAALRKEILEGRLRPGARVPGTRDLADQYRLSRGTIVAAFDQLRSEGYVEGSVGSGTYVSKVLPEDLLRVPARGRSESPKAEPGRSRRHLLSDYAKRLTPLSIYQDPRMRAFRPNVPALDLFPTALWAQVVSRRLRRVSPGLLLGCGSMGYVPLRQAVADYLSASRAVRCVPEQVGILSGVQEALDLTARVCLNPGDSVAMEDPGFVGAIRIFESAGAKIVPVPVDAEGMKKPGSSAAHSRLVYLTPAHQFPLGMTMSLRRRLEILDWAGRNDALIFEDDYDSEYRFSGRPVPTLQGLDRASLVILAGSFNKVMFPSFRMGYIVVPPDLVDHFAAAKSVTRHAPLLDQAALCDFLTEGHFARHIRRMREVYANRLEVLMEAGRERLGGLLEISSIEAGLQTVGWLRDGVKGESAARAAAARGVEVVPLSRYSRGRVQREGLQLGFAGVGVGEIRRGVRELAVAIQAAAAADPVVRHAAAFSGFPPVV